MHDGTSQHILATRLSVPPSRTEQALEVCVFVFLILPSLILSFFAVGGGGLNFLIGGTAVIFRDLALVALVLFFLWHNGEPVRRIGWRFRKRSKDIILGVALFVPMFYACTLVEWLLQVLGIPPIAKSMPASPVPHGAAQYVVATVMVAVVALSEETVFRGYLILRLRAVLGSTVGAVLLSSLIFAIGHGYEGTSGVITVGFMGLVFAVIYTWRRSLAAPITMHFLQDFLAIVMLPLLNLR